MQLHILAGMFDELEKIGVSLGQAGFMQSRRGTRPYRVNTLLNKQNSPGYVDPSSVAQNPELDQPPPAELAQEEDEGDTAVGKTAQVISPETQERAMHAFVGARPYVVGGLQAGVPVAVLGNIVGGRRTGAIAGAGATGAGVLNEYLKQWAQKHKRKAVAKKILEGQE
jgi:hypothetical protein